MLGSGFITINTKTYTPTTFSYKSRAIENILTSEAGTDLVNVVRLKKYTFELSWEGITYDLMTELEAYCYQNFVTFVWKGTSYSCRAREGSMNMIDRSWKYKNSDGLWNFTMTLTEL